jgi:hypothetical protein
MDETEGAEDEEETEEGAKGLKGGRIEGTKG